MNEKSEIPKAIEAEEAVLGAMLIDHRGTGEAMPLLKTSKMFYKPEHVEIFKAIEKIYLENNPIDIISISNELSKKDKLAFVGGEYYLLNLSNKISSSAHIEYHCRILQQEWLKREIIGKCDRIRMKAFQKNTDCFDLLNEDSAINDHLTEVIFKGTSIKTYSAALAEVAKRVELLSNQKEGEFTGVPTGFPKIDRFTGGWQPSDLIILAARPGMGKTAFVLKNAVECCMQKFPVGFFSLEMSINQLAARTIAINSNFHLSMLIRDGFKKDKYFDVLLQKRAEMDKFPFFIDDTPNLDIRDIVSKARIWKRKNGIKILFVDYIQLISDKTKGNNREQEIASISRNLKMLAKELDIPVIALSQLSRAVETRTDKHPKLSDLRESGAIEQDADIVTFLYRENYYNPDAVLPDYLTSQGANAEFSFAKYRAGSLETKGLYFDSNKVKYMDPIEINHSESIEDFPF